MTDLPAGAAPAAASVRAAGGPRPDLHSPLIDFVFLGGGSIPILLLLVLLVGPGHQTAVLLTASVLAAFVNNPHFMASYQIFYDRFPEKLRDNASGLRARYWIAGIAVPLALVGYFAWCAAIADPGMLGRAANVMFFLVGWHYVKQGYGVLIVESVLQRAFFSDREKDVLRWNGYAAWVFSWVYGNRVVQAASFEGMEYVTLGIPERAAWATGAAALATGLAALVVLGRRAVAGRLPFNGTCGYLSAVYLWMLLVHMNPIFLLLGPLFHSLQYLAVVWRYQMNKGAAADEDGEDVAVLSGLVRLSKGQAALAWFVLVGMMAGALAFYIVPIALDLAIAYREDLFGPSMFLFMFVVFINIHHYFMDNVMWRKENPDIRANLFR